GVGPMTWPRIRRLPALEFLEDRQLLNGSAPANTLATVQGTVAGPGATAEVSVPVTARNINGRIPIVIGTATAPAGGSRLVPRVTSALGPGGERLPIHQGAPSTLTHGESTAFVQVSTPGVVTLKVTGAHGTSGSFTLREYLPGDID